MTVNLCEITSKKEIGKGFFDYTFLCPDMAESAVPGQFVHILPEGFTLRRPISICEIIGDTIRIIFETRGEGTEKLSEKNTGDCFDVLGPLGNGFSLTYSGDKAIFIGGGIGVPPLLEASKRYGQNATIITGFRNSGAMILTEDFKKITSDVHVATDDGSFGHHGLVTDILKKRLERKADIMFACGPSPMLKAVKRLSEEYGVPAQLSLEERMGCGVGACLVCACKIQSSNGVEYRHVCKDGPVFNAEEVLM